MFGYIKKSKVLKIIERGQEQLRDKETDIFLNLEAPKSECEVRDFSEAINKLKGGIYYLECLKKHFR